jgi:hypothetical protein
MAIYSVPNTIYSVPNAIYSAGIIHPNSGYNYCCDQSPIPPNCTWTVTEQARADFSRQSKIITCELGGGSLNPEEWSRIRDALQSEADRLRSIPAQIELGELTPSDSGGSASQPGPRPVGAEQLMPRHGNSAHALRETR